MFTRSVPRHWPLIVLLAVAPAASWGVSAADGGQGRGRGAMRGMMGDPGHQADMQLIQTLFENRERIIRKVTPRPDGVETLTESDDPKVAGIIREHVASMTARVAEARPIHQRDPLFREIFQHTALIVMKQERTAKGIRVVETSTDPYVAKLIQAHADVVTAFIANGHAEAMKDHPVPPRGK